MKRLLTFLLTAFATACGGPLESPEDGEVGVATAELTSAVPFWWGNSHLTTGYGALVDSVDDGVLGWRGPDLQTPFGTVQTSAMTFDVSARSTTAEATLSWVTYAQATGDHRLRGPPQVFLDGFARASSTFQLASVDVYVQVKVRVNGLVREEVWHEVAAVTTGHGERKSSFTNRTVNVAHDFTVQANAGQSIKYEVVLFTRSSLQSSGKAFVAIRDFGVQTNAVPNTAHTIQVSAP